MSDGQAENPGGAGNEQGSPTELDLAWLAGLFDGEGWIGMRRQLRRSTRHYRYTAQANVTTTSERIKDNVLRILAAADVKPNIVETPARFHVERQQWHARRWDIRMSSNMRTKALLTLLKPYLVEKRQLAEIVLDYIEWREAQPHYTGKANQSLILDMKAHAEDVMAQLREDRFRNDPSTTTRLAPAALAG